MMGALGLVAATADAATVIRWGDVVSADHPAVKMIERVAKRVGEATQGRITVQAYPAGQLGSSVNPVLAVALALGTQDMVTAGADLFWPWVPSISVIEAPYVWRDAAHLAKVMAGPVGQGLTRRVVEQRGVRILGTTYYGVRHLTTSKKPVRTVADMKEFKLQLQEPDKVSIAMARAWGANPHRMGFSDLYLDLRQNVVDGQEGSLPTIDSRKFFEVQKYLVLTGHILTPRLVVINEGLWQRLPAADRQALADAVAEGIAWNDQEIQAREQALLTKFKQAGMEVITPDVESFRKPVVETLPKMFEAVWGKGTYEQILNTR
jgi:tripartite ATP-independent transporter DctP family solute receptor